MFICKNNGNINKEVINCQPNGYLMMNKRVHLAGILFATIFGFTFMFSKVALDYVIPIGLIAYRFLIAFFVIEILRRFKVIHIRFEKKHFKNENS